MRAPTRRRGSALSLQPYVLDALLSSSGEDSISPEGVQPREEKEEVLVLGGLLCYSAPHKGDETGFVMEMLSHAGRVVLISGGVRGIGRALAEGFLGAGGRVVVFHRGASNESREAERFLFEEQADALRERRLLVLRGDVTRKRDRSRILAETLRVFGRLDVLVHSAGVCYRENLTPQRIREQRRINATAPVEFSREAARVLRKNAHWAAETPTRGAIVALSSYVTEWRSFPAEYLRYYAASKRLLERGMKRLAYELRPDDINVNVIAVGVVYAGMGLATISKKEEALRKGELPVTKFANVDAVVFEALCLTHPRSHYKTGRVEVLDGGWNLGV